MASSTAISALQQHLAGQHPQLPLITPADPNFEATRLCFVRRDAVPSAIARPQNAEDVQALVRYCTANGIDFVVRSGGHDCAGRSQVHGALTIDLRDIKYVKISEDKKTASVGGGILFRDLAKELDAQELITPMLVLTRFPSTTLASQPQTPLPRHVMLTLSLANR
jgi:FAD/FMN-containing dehydrogenase